MSVYEAHWNPIPDGFNAILEDELRWTIFKHPNWVTKLECTAHPRMKGQNAGLQTFLPFRLLLPPLSHLKRTLIIAIDLGTKSNLNGPPSRRSAFYLCAIHLCVKTHLIINIEASNSFQVVVVIQQTDGSSTIQSFMAQCVHQKILYNKQTLPRRIEEALEE